MGVVECARLRLDIDIVHRNQKIFEGKSGHGVARSQTTTNIGGVQRDFPVCQAKHK